ncbi:MAG: hypothetical protein DSZ31_06600 [Gammaproteobacteria bacterium]|nr:MAG: hypothetical protein DSZ31_06600 [Gammaproteobacteria bacterium]
MFTKSHVFFYEIFNLNRSFFPKKNKYFIFFLDIKDSSRIIYKNNLIAANKIYIFLLITLKVLKDFVCNLEFNVKFVGDGIIILIPYNSKLKINEKFLKTLREEILNNLKRKNLKLDFRIVGGLGDLYCIEFGDNFMECIGSPLIFLIKNSKNISNFKWFGMLK